MGPLSEDRGDRGDFIQIGVRAGRFAQLEMAAHPIRVLRRRSWRQRVRDVLHGIEQSGRHGRGGSTDRTERVKRYGGAPKRELSYETVQ